MYNHINPYFDSFNYSNQFFITLSIKGSHYAKRLLLNFWLIPFSYNFVVVFLNTNILFSSLTPDTALVFYSTWFNL